MTAARTIGASRSRPGSMRLTLTAIWPTFTWPFRKRTREFDEGAYALGAAA